MKKLPSKICQSCGDKFYKKDYQSPSRFRDRIKFCSRSCRFHWQRVNGSWNKGKHYTPSLLKKMNFSGLEIGRGFFKGKSNVKIKGENHPLWKPKKIYHCPICKDEMLLAPWQSGRKFCSLRCRGLGKRGENSPVFKGEKSETKLRNRIRQMAEYTEWRLKCFRRDNFMCIKCKNPKSRPLEVHHINSYAKIKGKYKFTNPNEARKCNALWNIKNGITLCRSCHRRTKTYPKNLK